MWGWAETKAATGSAPVEEEEEEMAVPPRAMEEEEEDPDDPEEEEEDDSDNRGLCWTRRGRWRVREPWKRPKPSYSKTKETIGKRKKTTARYCYDEDEIAVRASRIRLLADEESDADSSDDSDTEPELNRNLWTRDRHRTSVPPRSQCL